MATLARHLHHTATYTPSCSVIYRSLHTVRFLHFIANHLPIFGKILYSFLF